MVGKKVIFLLYPDCMRVWANNVRTNDLFIQRWPAAWARPRISRHPLARSSTSAGCWPKEEAGWLTTRTGHTCIGWAQQTRPNPQWHSVIVAARTLGGGSSSAAWIHIHLCRQDVSRPYDKVWAAKSDDIFIYRERLTIFIRAHYIVY